MSVIGELLVEINGDNSGLKKSLSDSSTQMSSAINKMVAGISAAAIAWKGVDLAIQGINYNKAAEQAEIAFGVFLGSAGLAADMVERLRDLAKETPLEFAEVRDAAKQLSAFGVSANDVIPAMRRLADVSAGLNIPVKELSYLYGTIKTQGKAMTVDLMQFANRGIPIWEELAKVTGKSGTELRKMVEAGQIGFPEIEQAFKNMTSSTGDFYKMAEKQMKSFTGTQSNMNDTFDVFIGKATEGLMGPLKQGMTDIINIMTNAMGNIRTFGETLGTVLAGVVSVVNVLLAGLSYLPGQLTAIAAAAGLAFLAFGPWGAAIAAAVAGFAAIYNWTQEIANATEINAKKQKDAANALRASNQALNSQQSSERAAKEKADADAKKAAQELKKAADDRDSIEKSIKQEYMNQLGFINFMIESEKRKTQITADAATAKEASDAKEATGRQIVLGYQNASINAQIKAIGLEKDYQDEIDKTAKLYKDIEDSLKYAGTQFSSLASSMAKFGNDELSKLVSGFADIANNAGNLVGALAKGDYVAAAVSGVALIADAWSMFFGGRNKAQEEADKKAREAEAERVKAVKELESEYIKKFENDLTRLERERDERVAYARSIGADVLNIERYYAGEIAKINKQKIAGEQYAEQVSAEKKKKIDEQYLKDQQKLVDEHNRIWKSVFTNAPDSTLEDLRKSGSELAKALFENVDKEYRNALEGVYGELTLFKSRFSTAFDGLGSALTNSLQSGATLGDFRKTIMDMLRNMAIEAAVIAGGFQEKFKEIGVMIAEALKDGFSETELAAIDLRVNALYSQATNAINPLNELFNRAATAQNITNGGGTTINIQTTNDPLTIANALGNVQQSLAYQGVVA